MSDDDRYIVFDRQQFMAWWVRHANTATAVIADLPAEHPKLARQLDARG